MVVLDITANAGGMALQNEATMQWSTGSIARQTAPVGVIEPQLDMEKTVDIPVATPGLLLTYRMRIFHTGASGLDAYDVVITDTLPAGVIYVPGSLQFVTGSGTAPDALDDAATDPVTGQPALRAVWNTLPLGGESTIQFTALFGTVLPGVVVVNTASTEWTSLPGQVPALPDTYLSEFNRPYSHERRYDPLYPADVYRVTSTVNVAAPALPETGFAPGRMTNLPFQTTQNRYADFGGLRLEIPKLRQNLPVVGVPIIGKGWDLTWLWNKAGYLEGTAYPGAAGNSVITAHVYLSNGLPGPFVNLSGLRWGDQIILHTGGQRYVYAVRSVARILPSDNTVLHHEEYSWLTLLTCQGYNEDSRTYGYRTVVRAVLMRIEAGS